MITQTLNISQLYPGNKHHVQAVLEGRHKRPVYIHYSIAKQVVYSVV
jgi:hypothetical protein